MGTIQAPSLLLPHLHPFWRAACAKSSPCLQQFPESNINSGNCTENKRHSKQWVFMGGSVTFPPRLWANYFATVWVQRQDRLEISESSLMAPSGHRTAFVQSQTHKQMWNWVQTYTGTRRGALDDSLAFPRAAPVLQVSDLTYLMLSFFLWWHHQGVKPSQLSGSRFSLSALLHYQCNKRAYISCLS